MKRGRISISVFLCFLMMMFLVVSGCGSSDDAAPAATTYTVTFDSQSATVAASPTSKTVTSPATTVVTLPTPPTKTNYYFAGWWTTATSGGTEFIASTTVTASITVYARWSTSPVYTVTYDSQGGSAVGAQHVTSPATTVVTLPTAPTKTGYIFGGWYMAINGGGTAFIATTIVAEDIIVYAKWNSYTYTVTFDSQSATAAADPTSKTVTSPATTVDALPTPPTKTGSTFAGWFTIAVSGGTQFTATTPVTETITVYARWTTNPVYTVTYDSQGGSAVDAQHVTLPATTVGTLPAAPTKTGYTFGGWYMAINGGGTAFTATTAVTETITVYAKWTVIPGAFSQSDLTGTWRMNSLETGSYNGWARGTVTVNSTGTLSFVSLVNSSGDATAPTGVVWTIDQTTGVITESGTGGNPDNHYTMASNKTFIAGTQHSIGTTHPGLLIAQKEVSGTSYSNADLQSKSFVTHALHVGEAQYQGWEYDMATTDTNGLVTINSGYDSSTSGGPITPGVTTTTMSVDANGVVTMSGDNRFRGFLSADKKTIVSVDNSSGGEVCSLAIIQITGQTYTAGLLPAGISAAHMLAGGSSPAPFWVHFTITVASGGVITDSDWVASNSGITGNGTTDHGSISASGTVTIAGSDFHGQMSDDGKFMVGTQTLYTGVYMLNVTTK